MSAELNHHGTYPDFRIQSFASAEATDRANPRLEDLPAYTPAIRAIDSCRPVASYDPYARPGRWDEAPQRVEANRTIQQFVAAQPSLAFIDLWAAVPGPDGEARECTLTTRVTLFE